MTQTKNSIWSVLDQRTRPTFAFLKTKMEEYEMLKDEISLLKKDTEKLKFEPK